MEVEHGQVSEIYPMNNHYDNDFENQNMSNCLISSPPMISDAHDFLNLDFVLPTLQSLRSKKIKINMAPIDIKYIELALIDVARFWYGIDLNKSNHLRYLTSLHHIMEEKFSHKIRQVKLNIEAPLQILDIQVLFTF